MAFDAIFKKSTTLQDANPDPESGLDGDPGTPISPEDYSPLPTPTDTPRSPFKKVQLVLYSFYNDLFCNIYFFHLAYLLNFISRANVYATCLMLSSVRGNMQKWLYRVIS